jgi:anaerobic magnesium-protoporphyrin IX monomethyl ester cyclase
MLITVLEHPRIRSERRFNDIANTPLWSCLMGGYAAASLQAAGHDVTFIDTTTELWDFDRTERELLGNPADMLCINAVYFWEHTSRLFDFLSRLRESGYRAHICLFGFFPTLAYEVILRAVPEVDSLVVGECEETLAELARLLSRGQDWRTIPGVAFRTGEVVHLAATRVPAADPDRFAFPLRDLAAVETVSILASRGCYNHCSFCPVPSFYNAGPLWRGRSTANVMEEMTLLADQGVRDFYFVDPNFVGPGKNGRLRALELARLIRPLGITFGMETRPQDLDTEILEHLAAAGLQSMLLGIESGSPEVLGRLHKGARLNDSERAIELCRSVGIEPEVGFLMFVPDSTLEDVAHNFTFLQANNLLDRLERTANLLSHCQIVLMGTSDYRRFADQGRLTATGPLGFEGEIAFSDQRVKWMADLVVHACLYVLRDMSRPESPIWWRKTAGGLSFHALNQHLVDLFQRLLKDAHATNLPPLKLDIERELRQVIDRKGIDEEFSAPLSRHC